jgi:polyisoprenoid-binding protein YceI
LILAVRRRRALSIPARLNRRSSEACPTGATRTGTDAMNDISRRIPFAILFAAALGTAAAPAPAAEATYKIDPEHTYPSFEADHMGLSLWRGKFNRTEGSIALDKTAGTGSVEVRIDVTSVDFGLEKLNTAARGKELFDSASHPQATYRGRLQAFADGKPGEVVGDFTLHGVTRPLTLKVLTFKCAPHPVFKREVCGADAEGSFQRDEFGMAAGKEYGFDMTVKLRIQVEAIAEPSADKSS